METIKPQQNQNILDISLQEYGSIEMIFDIVEKNGFKTLTPEISVYEDVLLPNKTIEEDITGYYKASGFYPATLHSQEDLDALQK